MRRKRALQLIGPVASLPARQLANRTPHAPHQTSRRDAGRKASSAEDQIASLFMCRLPARFGKPKPGLIIQPSGPVHHCALLLVQRLALFKSAPFPRPLAPGRFITNPSNHLRPHASSASAPPLPFNSSPSLPRCLVPEQKRGPNPTGSAKTLISFCTGVQILERHSVCWLARLLSGWQTTGTTRPTSFKWPTSETVPRLSS